MKKVVTKLQDGELAVDLIPETPEEIEESRKEYAKSFRVIPNVDGCRVFPVVYDVETFLPKRYISLKIPNLEEKYGIDSTTLIGRGEIHMLLDEVLDNPYKYDLDNQNITESFIPGITYEGLLVHIKNLETELKQYKK